MPIHIYPAAALVVFVAYLASKNDYLKNWPARRKEKAPLVQKRRIVHVTGNSSYIISVDVLSPSNELAWTEGPMLVEHTNFRHLLFTDTELDRIYKYTEPIDENQSSRALAAATWMEIAGGLKDEGERKKLQEPGANGLVIHPSQKTFLIFQHGSRQIVQASTAWLEKEKLTIEATNTVVASYKGKRFHSPNDGVFTKDGSVLFFTDPPYGLRDNGTNLTDQEFLNTLPTRELDFQGVYVLPILNDADVTWNNQQVQLLATLPRPNGIALSSDESVLFVSNSGYSDPLKAKESLKTVSGAFIMAYTLIYESVEIEIKSDASENFHDLSKTRIILMPTKAINPQKIIDFSSNENYFVSGPGSTDGIKIDPKTNRLYVSGPGGVFIFDIDILTGSGEQKEVKATHIESYITKTAIGNVVLGNCGDIYICASQDVIRVRHDHGLL